MIALIFADLCTGCGICHDICPTDVFDRVPETSLPLIARQRDCQTCFMCELYCPADALYVDPDCEAPAQVDAQAVRDAGHAAVFRRNSGWGRHSGDPAYPNLHWRMDQVFARAREMLAPALQEKGGQK